MVCVFVFVRQSEQNVLTSELVKKNSQARAFRGKNAFRAAMTYPLLSLPPPTQIRCVYNLCTCVCMHINIKVVKPKFKAFGGGGNTLGKDWTTEAYKKVLLCINYIICIQYVC